MGSEERLLKVRMLRHGAGGIILHGVLYHSDICKRIAVLDTWRRLLSNRQKFQRSKNMN